MNRILVAISLFFLCSCIATGQLPTYELNAGSEARLFSYTNKAAAFYCGPLNASNSSGFHGITSSKQKLFENYWIRLGNVVLNRSTASVQMTPAGFVRTYPFHNTVEKVFFADSLTLLHVGIETEYRGEVTIIPGWSPGFQHGTTAIRKNRLSVSNGLQGVVSISRLPGEWEAPDETVASRLRNPGSMYIPAWYIGTVNRNSFAFIVEFLPSDSPLPERKDAEYELMLEAKKARISSYLADIGFECSDKETQRTFNWIAASMDALVTEYGVTGIWAGLPWFDDYWGRDTFISLPGALLITGRFETAKKVLRTFARLQNTDVADSSFGRIPNRVQPEDIIYNTVDGTPWFIIQAWKYISASGDRAFANEIFPAIRRAIEGTIRYHLDQSGFLVHGDAETWMDAVGPQGPWSPRGNRAIEIQLLWNRALYSAALIAKRCGRETEAADWLARQSLLEKRIFSEFRNPADSILADHLNTDGTFDRKIRPNILLVASGKNISQLEYSETMRTLFKVFSSCVYPHGVASLAQSDSGFFPYHTYPERYPKDAAYHNGTIWTWLSGPAVSLLCRAFQQDSAWLLTETLQRLAMETGAIGTIPECTDAFPRRVLSFPDWSGTFSQAWSNAEYLRNMFEDYLGISVFAAPDSIPVISILPKLPSVLEHTAINVRIADNLVRFTCGHTDGVRMLFAFRHVDGRDTIKIQAPHQGLTCRAPHYLSPGETLWLKCWRLWDSNQDWSFCIPHLDSTLASLQPPQHDMIPGMIIKRRNPESKLIYTGTDPTGDDKGRHGNYTYPDNPLFPSGIFDITGFEVREDRDNVYFTVRMKALSQPGWHPEYGFQLTMLAIAIGQSGNRKGQSRYIRHNSRYTLPPHYAFDKLILIGGGIQIEDREGNILAGFIPRSEEDAFGDVRNGTISFAIPRSYLGYDTRNRVYTIVSGGQDDHGGAGIGEFRTVLKDRGTWNGGGNSTAGSNTYDVFHSE